ncbi:hypothetical protein AABM26_13820 [Curtobacterium aetherium]|uniref:hypothetical protein n=1 Tax=Curtobacterium aetherium TaxID=2841594 RepID=UPI003B526C05
MQNAFRVLVAVVIALPIERPALVTLVDDDLELTRLRRTAPQRCQAASESSGRASERGDLGLEGRDVSCSQNGVETHAFSLARTANGR